MMKTVLMTAIAATIALAPAAMAEGSLSDVPAGHWANGAVNELQSRGIITGYPDGTFGGKRAVTRYEFALAGQRVLQDAQRRLDAIPAAPRPGVPSPLATRGEVDARIQGLQTAVGQLRLDVDELRRTMTRLQARASTLRSEVDEMRQQLGDVNNRVSGIRSQRPFGSGHRP